jgi:hypothetical protein
VRPAVQRAASAVPGCDGEAAERPGTEGPIMTLQDGDKLFL